MITFRRTYRLLRQSAILAALSVATACAPSFRNHGYIPLEEDLSQIVVGVDTRASVEDIVGPPSAAGVLSDAGYFYVRSRVRTIGPRRPEVVDRQVLAISFSQEGVVQNIERFGLQDGRIVTLSRRVTDNGTANQNILQQLLRNIGRFDPTDFVGSG